MKGPISKNAHKTVFTIFKTIPEIKFRVNAACIFHVKKFKKGISCDT